MEEEKPLSCSLDSFPYALYGHSATIIPTGILVCGGSSSSGSTNRCYEYKKANSSWQSFPPMTTNRYFFDMKLLNQEIWAFGGMGGYRSETTLDKFDVHKNVWTKYSMPFRKQYCLTKLTLDKLILIGGHGTTSVSEKNARTKFSNQIIFLTFSYGQ